MISRKRCPQGAPRIAPCRLYKYLFKQSRVQDLPVGDTVQGYAPRET
jgi:hypothetical protein